MRDGLLVNFRLPQQKNRRRDIKSELCQTLLQPSPHLSSWPVTIRGHADIG